MMKRVGLVRRFRRLRGLKQNLLALYLALGDPRVPRLPKVITGLVLVYGISPVDLLPDVIPLLGWVDDLLIVPAGIRLAMHLVPIDVWEDCRRRASRQRLYGRRILLVIAVIVAAWLLMIMFTAR